NRVGRDHQGFAGAVRLRLPAVDRVFERPREDVDDLLARVLVPDRRRLRAEFDAVLDHCASGNAEVVRLQIGAPESGGLLDCGHASPSWRTDLNAARSSAEKSCGSSQAAKWPPLPTVLK